MASILIPLALFVSSHPISHLISPFSFSFPLCLFSFFPCWLFFLLLIPIVTSKETPPSKKKIFCYRISLIVFVLLLRFSIHHLLFLVGFILLFPLVIPLSPYLFFLLTIVLIWFHILGNFPIPFSSPLRSLCTPTNYLLVCVEDRLSQYH